MEAPPSSSPDGGGEEIVLSSEAVSEAVEKSAALETVATRLAHSAVCAAVLAQPPDAVAAALEAASSASEAAGSASEAAGLAASAAAAAVRDCSLTKVVHPSVEEQVERIDRLTKELERVADFNVEPSEPSPTPRRSSVEETAMEELVKVLNSGDTLLDSIEARVARLKVDFESVVVGGKKTVEHISVVAKEVEEEELDSEDEDSVTLEFSRARARARWRAAIRGVCDARKSTKKIVKLRIYRNAAKRRDALRAAANVHLKMGEEETMPAFHRRRNSMDSGQSDRARRVEIEQMMALALKDPTWRQVAGVLALPGGARTRADLDILEEVVLRSNVAEGSLADILRSTTKANRHEILAQAVDRRVTNVVLQKLGTTILSAYLIISGSVELTTTSLMPDGTEVCVSIGALRNGDSFGEVAFQNLATTSCSEDFADPVLSDCDLLIAEPTWLIEIPRSAALAIAHRRHLVERGAIASILSTLRLSSASDAKYAPYVEEMHNLATRRCFANGDVITRQGAMPKCIFLLISGECRALRSIAVGSKTAGTQRKISATQRGLAPSQKSRRKLHFELPPRMYPGDIFGFGGDLGYHPYSVIATTLVDVLAIDVTALFGADEQLHNRLIAAAAERYSGLLCNDQAVITQHHQEESRLKKTRIEMKAAFSDMKAFSGVSSASSQQARRPMTAPTPPNPRFITLPSRPS